MAVYQTERFGNFTYTIPGLSPGASFTVRLHFAEFFWTAAGQRVFNVVINGTQVLTNFDIIAASGAPNKAIVEQFTATANSSGQIVIQYVTVTDNAKSSGIEILSGGSCSAPTVPGGLAATAVSSSQINLSWTDNSTDETGFKIESCQNAGCTNFAQIAQVGTNTTSFSNTGLSRNTRYRYRVRAFNTGGNSAYSNIAAARTLH